MELFVSPEGQATWSGRLAAPNKGKTDGPLPSIEAAQMAIRALKGQGFKNKNPGPTPAMSEPITVWVRGGRYELSKPLEFAAVDSYPVTYAAYRNEKPVIDGGRVVTGWTETTINGRKAWVAELPEVREGKWAFRELFVNGRRASRPRLPKQGLYRMAEVPGMKLPTGWGSGGQTRFVCKAGDVQAYANLSDVEVVYVHFWIEERSPIASFDGATNTVSMVRPSRCEPVGSFGSQLADYYLDNVKEALDTPGEWYLDRGEGRLYYLPRKGETPANTEVIAPRCMQLLAVIGSADEGKFVEFVRFKGLTFRHTDWRHPSEDGVKGLGSSGGGGPEFSRRHSRGNRAAAAQAACDVPGVIAFEAARCCAIEDCVIEHVGWYGLEIGDACQNIRVVGNTIRDLGAGGVKINGAAARDREVHRRTGMHRITDNTICEGGRIFHSAVGVLSMHAHGMYIAYNHIFDLYYSGVSVGWEWGYQESVSRDNWIEYNHIHDLGHGLLSDMGGIYTLGVQPGTVIRGNHIYNVKSAHYGGWCIYPDEGTSHVVIENNLCHDADRQAFHQHYGRENTVRNNIFAFGGDAAATYSRTDNHLGITFTRNIFITDDRPMFSTGYHHQLSDKRFASELNVFFDVSGKKPRFQDAKKKQVSLAEWKALGHDQFGLAGNPGCRNPAKRDFRLVKNAAALKVGFVPLDLAKVGPRKKSQRD